MMWMPTHVQVTVHKARNLIPKGKQGTNDSYVTIQVGKEKYQTTVKEKSDSPEWNEECDLQLPPAESQGKLQLNVLHRNLFGMDEFLGHVSIPLEQFQVYERPRARWYPLKNKPGAKKAEKYRGEIEVKVTFVVQSMSSSDMNISKMGKIKRASSIKSLVGDKLTMAFPGMGTPPGGSDLYGEKRTFSGGTNLHDGVATVFQHQEVLPTEFRNPTHEEFSQKKISNPQLENIPTESVEEKGSGDSPQFFKRTQSLTRSDLKQCRASTVESTDNTPGAQSMLNLTEAGIDTPKDSPNMQHIEKAVQRTESSASEKSDDEFSRFNRRRQPILRGSMSRKKSESGSEGSSLSGSFRSTTTTDKSHPSEPSGMGSFNSKLSGGKKVTPPPTVRHMSDVGSVTTEVHKPSPLLLSDSTDLSMLPEESPSRETTPSATSPKSPPTFPPSFLSPQVVDHSETQFEMTENVNLPSKAVEKTSAKQPTGRKNSEPPVDVTDHERRENQKNNSEKKETHHLIDPRLVTVQRRTGDKTFSKDSGRRHTMGYTEDIKLPAYQLQGINDCRQSHDDSKSLSAEVVKQYDHMSREELVQQVVSQKSLVFQRDCYIRDMEAYIDNLLVKVMENQPRLLQSPTPSPPQRSSLNNKNNTDTSMSSSGAHTLPPFIPSKKISNQTVAKLNNSKSSKSKPSHKRSINPFKRIQAALK